MASRYVMDAISELARRLRARFGERVRWVRLYGSQARGDAREGSDVDALAVVAELTWSEKIEAIDLGFDVSMATGLHLSTVVMAEADFDRLVALESPFAGSVLRERIAA